MSGPVVVLTRESRSREGRGELEPASLHAVRAGRAVAELSNRRLELAIEAASDREQPMPRELPANVDAVWELPWRALAGDADPRGTVACLAAFLRERSAAIVVLPHSYRSVDLLGLLVDALDGTGLTEVVGVRRRGEPAAGPRSLIWRKPVFNGRLIAEIESLVEPVVLTAPAAFGGGEASQRSSPAGAEPPVEAVPEPESVDRGEAGAKRSVLEIEEAPEGVSLADAKRLVSVGRGLGGPEHVDLVARLARALDAELAASRPVVDAGWLPRERQVGSSGQSVGPDLYLALGISGSSQHLQGLADAGCIVAVNIDDRAPILRVARYAILRDLHDVVPALLRVLEGG